jgi:hypothetical protein
LDFAAQMANLSCIECGKVCLPQNQPFHGVRSGHSVAAGTFGFQAGTRWRTVMLEHPAFVNLTPSKSATVAGIFNPRQFLTALLVVSEM